MRWNSELIQLVCTIELIMVWFCDDIVDIVDIVEL